jgi:hypothetical protein
MLTQWDSIPQEASQIDDIHDKKHGDLQKCEIVCHTRLSVVLKYLQDISILML